MKTKKFFSFALVAAFVLGILLTSCDPRKNCNHPDHGRYMQEKIAKKRGLPK